ncbi:MAG: substrate-binding domain-containing protein [Thermoguttaceae bacterium]
MRSSAFLFFLVFFVFLAFSEGCKKKERVTIYGYCDATYWDLMQEASSAFATIYGVDVIIHPIVPSNNNSYKESTASDKNSDQTRPIRTSIPWENAPTFSAKSEYTPLTLDANIVKLIDSIGTNRGGDFYIADSPLQRKYLDEVGQLGREYPFCFLTPVFVVAKGNPQKIVSIDDLMNRDRRLGVMHPGKNGMGSAATAMISESQHGYSPEVMDNFVKIFDQPDDLIEAFQRGEVDGAIIWNVLLPKYADQVEEVPISSQNKSYSAIPQSLFAISATKNDYYAKRFGDFLVSPAGQRILKKHGFLPDQIDLER